MPEFKKESDNEERFSLSHPVIAGLFFEQIKRLSITGKIN